MSFSKRLKDEYLAKLQNRDFTIDSRYKALREANPELDRIERELIRLNVALLKSKLDSESIEMTKESIEGLIKDLKSSKSQILSSLSLPKDYLNPPYDCNKCKDTGTLKDRSCSCFTQKLVKHYYKVYGNDVLLERENFSTFDINRFSEEIYGNEKVSPRENMLKILDEVDKYLLDFRDKNLMFFGLPGTGKTFLCNCIAKSLIDKGNIVIYQPAFRIIEILRDYRFRRDEEEAIDYTGYNLLFNSDVLIIDDLGTEIASLFSHSELFNVINSRLNSKRSTIISTNLTMGSIKEIYSERISSRLFGSFQPYKFYGKDLRWQ